MAAAADGGGDARAARAAATRRLAGDRRRRRGRRTGCATTTSPQFVAGAVIAERGATDRLAHAFQALVPDTDRQRRLLGPGARRGGRIGARRRRVVRGALGQGRGDAHVVLGREVRLRGLRPGVVARADPRGGRRARRPTIRPSGSPPGSSTVADASLRDLDHRLLAGSARHRGRPGALARHRRDDRARTPRTWCGSATSIRRGSSPSAILRQAERRSGPAAVPPVLERFGRGASSSPWRRTSGPPTTRRSRRFERLCRAIGTPVIAPLAEALSTEQDARSRRRLRDILVDFGAQGRESVQQLMNAPNWEVRRTAAFLLREFGGAEGLQRTDAAADRQRAARAARGGPGAGAQRQRRGRRDPRPGARHRDRPGAPDADRRS